MALVLVFACRCPSPARSPCPVWCFVKTSLLPSRPCPSAPWPCLPSTGQHCDLVKCDRLLAGFHRSHPTLILMAISSRAGKPRCQQTLPDPQMPECGLVAGFRRVWPQQAELGRGQQQHTVLMII